MAMPNELSFRSGRRAPQKLSPSIATLGLVSMLTAVSSAMIYGLLPLFMVKVLAISVASVGFIEGMAGARKFTGQDRVRCGKRLHAASKTHRPSWGMRYPQ